MRILVLNGGSSSLKYRLTGGERPVVGGAVTGIGGMAKHDEVARTIRDHAAAVRWVFERLAGEPIEAVGHRVVHGGARLRESVVLDEEALAAIAASGALAPEHNRASLEVIRATGAALPGVPMVAVFDTTFHRTLPARATTYALPGELAARHGIRRYGFHGIAHASLAAGCARLSGRPLESLRLITLQLGSGCSAAAIESGRSVDTSMGLTPLEGLVMSTRCGDLDPGAVLHLVRGAGLEAAEVERMLHEESGLVGISRRSSEMGELLAAERRGDADAALAVELFCYRARKYVGAYLAVLGGADAVVFGGGVGENAPQVRARICAGMAWCGLTVDAARNEAAVGLAPGAGARISGDDASMSAWVVAVDEEDWIAKETLRCLEPQTRARP